MRFGFDGERIVVLSEAREQEVLSGLLREFTALTASRRDDPMRGEKTPKDPALARLLPDPVHADDEASAELRFLTEAALITHKLTNAAAVEASLAASVGEPARLDDAQELAWLKTLTDLRLVLAARLAIERDDDLGRDATEVDRWMQTAYHWLGATQAELLDTIEARDAMQEAEVDDAPGAIAGDEPAR